MSRPGAVDLTPFGIFAFFCGHAGGGAFIIADSLAAFAPGRARALCRRRLAAFDAVVIEFVAHGLTCLAGNFSRPCTSLCDPRPARFLNRFAKEIAPFRGDFTGDCGAVMLATASIVGAKAQPSRQPLSHRPRTTKLQSHEAREARGYHCRNGGLPCK